MSVTTTVNRAELGSALTFASLGLATHPVVPALTAVRVTAGPAGLELSAFDYETYATVKVAGDTSGGEAATLVNGKELTAAVKSLPAGKKFAAEVTATDEGLSVTCDGTQVTVPALPAEFAADYPAYPPVPAVTGTVDGAAFARGAARTAACAGKDDTLPVLTHVNFTSENGTLELAATDRYKLAVDRQPLAGADGTAMVPAALLAKFAKQCDKTGKVSVSLDGEHAALSDGARTLVTRACVGEYVRYRKMLERTGDLPTVVTAAGPALFAAVTRAGKVTGKNERMKFGVSDAGVTLTAVRDGKVTGTQVVPATLTGPPQETGFSPPYLASVLSGVAGIVTVSLPANPDKPAGVTSADGFTAIVMPLRLAA